MSSSQSKQYGNTEEILKALQERPSLSIKMQIYISFFFAMIIIFGIGSAHVISIYKLEKKIKFLEIADNYLFELQQARRFEKNYFLHGANLKNALKNLAPAKKIFLDNADRWEDMVGKETVHIILFHLLEYEQALKKLSQLKNNGDEPTPKSAKISETEISQHGHKLLSLAVNLQKREKNNLDRMLLTSRKVHVLTLIILFVYIGFIIYFLGLRILKPINRFLRYTRRIADGDFTPITPARRYRDEFSQLAIAINHMIRELDQRQNSLIESHKLRAIGTLTAGVAHELNNPLNNITITSYMLLEDFDELDNDEKKEMVRDVIQETDRAQGIVSGLLDFARESKSKVQALDIGEVLEETLHLARNQLTVKGVNVDFQIAPNLPNIYADKQQLTQVFLNLIINALDVSKKNQVIIVQAVQAVQTEDPKFIDIKVTDHGSGIPEHILNSIFDPFFTTKGKRGGTGLGLSVSKGIISKFGGHMSVSTQSGKGSTFTVSLPVTSIPADFQAVKQKNQPKD